MRGTAFLPVSREEMIARDWYYYDFLVVTADAYIDHPSFGTTLIARVLESEGYRVAILAQPDWHSADAFRAMGKPRYGVMIGGGNLDSMVAHYTVAKRRRTQDLYSPGGKMGCRPDRPTIVYANRAREAFPDTPIVIGGLEASLRRFAHYDYWDDKVRRSILFDAPADLLTYGMGESATREIARRLAAKVPVKEITDVPGTAYIAADDSGCHFHRCACPSYEEVCADKTAYALATKIQYEEHDPVRGNAVLQPCQGRLLVVNPPARPLPRAELDKLYDLPYVREVHPMYEEGVPAIEEVRFSITHNRGCFGGCNFCSLAFHQGRMVTSRSIDSVVREAEMLTHDPKFKGYIHDVGGPTANFRHTSCKKQKEHGMCKGRSCLAPEPCPNLDADHSEYTELLQRLRAVPGIKKVFVRSGIRYDYLLQDSNKDFFRELVNYHISGQLKVAPEHCVAGVLDYMGKPHFDVFLKFWRQYQKLNEKDQKEQYLVPYLMSSHPGCTLNDAVELAEFLKRTGRNPEQVQDFYPTPGTLSTCMYYTGIDPRDMSEVYVARDPHDKALQRALLQFARKDKRALVIEALEKADRTDLIGFEPNCLIRPVKGEKYFDRKPEEIKKPAKKRDGRGPRPEGTVHRGRRNTPGQKGKMSAKKKAAFAKKRNGK
ncbi:MAG: YgiQ family radical SAM protein [Clostridiales bacterium]|nr:YgiQ family radical SAM protein [Candidatus Cacconaster stercorequi]